MESVVQEELIWNNPICQSRTETLTEFSLPDAKTVVKKETEESSTTLSLDFCCQAFAAGDVSMRDACDITEQNIDEEFVWDGS